MAFQWYRDLFFVLSYLVRFNLVKNFEICNPIFICKIKISKGDGQEKCIFFACFPFDNFSMLRLFYLYCVLMFKKQNCGQIFFLICFLERQKQLWNGSSTKYNRDTKTENLCSFFMIYVIFFICAETLILLPIPQNFLISNFKEIQKW